MDAPYDRRLAAILSADVVGYTRLIAEDQEGTLRTLDIYRAAIADLMDEHGGQIFGTAGDAFRRICERSPSRPRGSRYPARTNTAATQISRARQGLDYRIASMSAMLLPRARIYLGTAST